jgi:GTP-binding protein LepA
MRRAITIQKAMVTTTMATTTATSTPTTVTAINGPTPGSEPIEPASLFPTAECPCPHLRYAGPSVLPVDRIRNFSIISHVDHGKSTLSDRILELTGAVDPRLMREQYLDSMDIERERGITIKAQNVRVPWKDYTLHLIDTPGHVDFGYEVSRSLAACEGAVLLVDASQGIQAQTLANCYQALEHDHEIVAVLNKIDLPAADPERCAAEIEQVLGLAASGILHISAKTGEGVPELLDAIVERIPAPTGDPDAPLRALIFDSAYDQYRGVVSSIRVMDGTLVGTDKLRFMQAGSNHEIEEIGIRSPVMVPVDELGPGEVGYLIAGIKNVGGARSGETVTTASHPASTALAGYRDPKPMVFCGLFPIDGDELPDLRDALEKLRLNDASFTYEPESSRALGFGFRCGFLGLLHMEIVRERLEREFDLSLIATAPSVAYRAFLNDGTQVDVDNPSELPEPTHLDHVDEPILKATILTPAEYTGTVMDLCQGRRAEMIKMEYLSPERVEFVYSIPLAEVVVNFFDQLKSRTKGYASLDYEPEGYTTSDLVKVDLLINHTPVDAFSTIVHRSQADFYGRRMTEKLRELIPRQMFDVPIQAAIGGRVLARETVKARRKDVLAKCYGGDITRKRKLLEKQKEGKKKMKNIGRVEVPQEAFVSALRLDD